METEQEDDVTTEEYETNTDSEGETQEETGSEDDGTSEDTSDRTYTQAELDARIKEQDKRWKDRLKKSGKENEKSDNPNKEDYLRLDLKTEGVKDKKEQDIILNYIKEKALLGEEVSTTEALGKMVIKEALSEMRATSSIPAPSSRTSGGSNDSYDYYAKNIKAGKMRLSDVTDAGMREKLMKGKLFS